VRVRQFHDSAEMAIDSRQVKITAVPDADGRNFNVSMEFFDAVVRIAQSESFRERFSRTFTIPIPPQLANLPQTRTAGDYIRARNYPAGAVPESQKQLMRALLIIGNTVRTELHARVSFAVSCLILVMVGCAL